jgi:hypothetical protein
LRFVGCRLAAHASCRLPIGSPSAERTEKCEAGSIDPTSSCCQIFSWPFPGFPRGYQAWVSKGLLPTIMNTGGVLRLVLPPSAGFVQATGASVLLGLATVPEIRSRKYGPRNTVEEIKDQSPGKRKARHPNHNELRHVSRPRVEGFNAEYHSRSTRKINAFCWNCLGRQASV